MPSSCAPATGLAVIDLGVSFCQPEPQALSREHGLQPTLHRGCLEALCAILSTKTPLGSGLSVIAVCNTQEETELLLGQGAMPDRMPDHAPSLNHKLRVPRKQV